MSALKHNKVNDNSVYDKDRWRPKAYNVLTSREREKRKLWIRKRKSWTNEWSPERKKNRSNKENKQNRFEWLKKRLKMNVCREIANHFQYLIPLDRNKNSQQQRIERKWIDLRRWNIQNGNRRTATWNWKDTKHTDTSTGRVIYS